MSPLLAHDLLTTLHGVIVLLVILGVWAACFNKLVPAVLCIGVALLLIVLR